MTTLYRVSCGDWDCGCEQCTEGVTVFATFAEAQLACPEDGRIEKLTAGQPVEDVTPVMQTVEEERLTYHTCYQDPIRMYWKCIGDSIAEGFKTRRSLFENFARFDGPEWSARSVEYPIT